MPISIGFHDVVEEISQAPAMGAEFTTMYTIDRSHFRDCLTAMHSRVKPRSVQLVDGQVEGPDTIYLTVDDGRASSFTIVAPELERLDWRGHFFITTDWIGRPGFLDPGQIRDLHERGHLIGSHSCSHPFRMWSLPFASVVREWQGSRDRLRDILGSDVTVASVPGGYYAPRVGEAAQVCGYRVLFTSEPTVGVSFAGSCRILGRYTVRRHTSASNVAGMAAGEIWPRTLQAARWSATKAAKRVAGRWYLPLRRTLLGSSVAAHRSEEQVLGSKVS